METLLIDKDIETPHRPTSPALLILKTEERGPGVSNRVISGLMDRELTCLDQGPG